MPIDSTASNADQLMWEQLFPTGLATYHALIACKLTQAIRTDIELGADLNALLAEDWQWLTTELNSAALATPLNTDGAPMTQAQLNAAANALRQQLKNQKKVSRFYLVDCILAELQHGQTLNSELFAIFKKLTLLCAIALTRVNLAAQIAEDGSVDAALRNVRLAADRHRGPLLTFLSEIEMQVPLETLIYTIEVQRPEFAKNKALTGQVDNLLRVLVRLAEQQSKRSHGGGGNHRPTEKQQIEYTPLALNDDTFQITRVTTVTTHQGLRRLSAEELEMARDQIADQETWLVALREPPAGSETDEEGEPGRLSLMDWQAHFQQGRSVALSMSLRSQMLSCDPGCASERHISTLVRALCRPTRKTPAQLALLMMLVLGMDWSTITNLPLWSQPPARFPQAGSSFRGDDKQHNGSALWCYPALFALQRWHEVANSRVHKDLDHLLPPVHFYLLLPLPQELRELIDDTRLFPCSHAAMAQELKSICKRYQLNLTVTQLTRYLTQWLQRNQVDDAISGLLRGKTAQQCAPLAYSYLDSTEVLTVWHTYLAQLGLQVEPVGQPVGVALGSRLLPYHDELRIILARYQLFLARTDTVKLRRKHDPHYHNLLVRHTLLLLNLATGARPVSDMYDSLNSYDPLMGIIRLVDKEGRNCSSARLVPLASQAQAQLQELIQHLALLSRRREPELRTAAIAAGQALESQHPMLFWLDYEGGNPADPRWQVQPMTVQSMQDHFDTLLPLPANWHRHALRSTLLARQVAPWLINAVLGHEEMGQEFGHPNRAADLNSLRALAPIVGDWLGELGLEPLPGWGSA